MSLRARVLGFGLWMPGFPDPASWLSGQPVAGADIPSASGPNAAAQAKMRRRSSLLVNMVADVATQASEQAGVPLSRLRIVVGSAFGELATLVEMLDERERDGLLSPLRFQNSVHNSAAGHLSIAHRNKTPAMSLAAGNDTVAMVLLEAMTLLALGGDEVLAIVGDEPLPPSIGRGSAPPRSSAALVLARDVERIPPWRRRAAGARDARGSAAGARGRRLRGPAARGGRPLRCHPPAHRGARPGALRARGRSARPRTRAGRSR